MPHQAAAADAAPDLGLYRALFAAYPDALLLVDLAGQVVLANPAATELLGYTPSEFLGLPVDDLVPDGIRPRHAAHRAAYARQPHPRPMGSQMELVARCKDGREVMVEIALSPLQAEGLPYVVAAIREIGLYPRVRQALQRARYGDFLAQVGRFAVDTRDPQQLLQRIPQAAVEALQADSAVVYLLEANRLEFRVAGVAGASAPGALGAQVPNRADTLPGLALSQDSPLRVSDLEAEHRFVVAEEQLQAELRSALAVPLSDRGQAVGVLAVRSRQAGRFGDEESRFLQLLAHLLAASLQRSQSEEALNHAQRLESVGQLTGGIAHDFNNLLTVIQGNLQVLEELPGLGSQPGSAPLVAAALRATRRAAELTAKLLAFSRRQVLQPRAVELRPLLESLAEMLRRTLDQRIRITVEVAPDCPPCRADAHQLESSLLNIAINSRDAMPEGGELRFSARPCESLPPSLRAELGAEPGAMPPQDYVQIAVADSGAGMPDAVKARAFEPFFTTKESGRGTGLGLSTVYGFAKQSQGAVLLDSRLGGGTTVSLLLPRDRDETVAEAAPGVAVAPLPAGLRVLLVEDDPEVRSLISGLLRAQACELQSCATAEGARLELALPTRYDLLLSDVALGSGMRGTELAAWAQRQRPGLAVLLMSGYSAQLLDPQQTLPWPVLQKPFTREQFALTLARVLARQGALSKG